MDLTNKHYFITTTVVLFFPCQSCHANTKLPMQSVKCSSEALRSFAADHNDTDQQWVLPLKTMILLLFLAFMLVNVVNPNCVWTLTGTPCLHANGLAQVAQQRGMRDGWNTSTVIDIDSISIRVCLFENWDNKRLNERLFFSLLKPPPSTYCTHNCQFSSYWLSLCVLALVCSWRLVCSRAQHRVTLLQAISGSSARARVPRIYAAFIFCPTVMRGRRPRACLDSRTHTHTGKKRKPPTPPSRARLPFIMARANLSKLQ